MTLSGRGRITTNTTGDERYWKVDKVADLSLKNSDHERRKGEGLLGGGTSIYKEEMSEPHTHRGKR